MKAGIFSSRFILLNRLFKWSILGEEHLMLYRTGKQIDMDMIPLHVHEFMSFVWINCEWIDGDSNISEQELWIKW